MNFLRKIKETPIIKTFARNDVRHTESEKENIIKAIQAGAINYMVKPFSIEELTKENY